jgi:hypothetical protein
MCVIYLCEVCVILICILIVYTFSTAVETGDAFCIYLQLKKIK